MIFVRYHSIVMHFLKGTKLSKIKISHFGDFSMILVKNVKI